MTYLDFLSEIGINSNISWSFCQQSSINDNNMNNLLNNIAFSFLDKESKKDLYIMIQNTELNDTQAMKIKFLIEEEFSNIFKKYPIRKTLIEKFVDNLIVWIEIQCDKIDNCIIQNILENITTKNIYFWYILVKKLYEKSNHKEALFLVNEVKYLFIDNYLYEEFILQEIKIIKHLDYINNKELLKQLCNLSKKITSFKYERIIIKLECSLLNHKIINKKIEKYYQLIKKFDMIQLLNVYELVILSQDLDAIETVRELLIIKNIYDYHDLKEFNTFMLLENIRLNNMEEFNILRKQKVIEDSYDFRHIDWYLKNNV